jgi:formylglycine-generating enzyme required for sulfatase activity
MLSPNTILQNRYRVIRDLGHGGMGTVYEALEDEKPVHRVMIGSPFYIGRFEVTQAQWQAVMDNNPAHFEECGGNCPVETVLE